MADKYNLKTTLLNQQDPHNATMSYDEELDTLYVHLDVSPRLHVACYLDDGVYALFDPNTMEVVGFQVENWKRVFLRLHPDLQQILQNQTEEPSGHVVEAVRLYAGDECYA